MEGGCGGVEVRNKVEKKKKKKKMKEKDEKRIFGCFETFRHSFSFSLLLNQIISITHPPIPPKYPSLSITLWMNTQTHTSLTHIYHTNQKPSMSSPEFKSLPNSSFSISKQHTQSPSLSLPHKTIISLVNPQNQSLTPLLTHSSHWIQERD